MSQEEVVQVNPPGEGENVIDLKAEIERLKAQMLKLEEAKEAHDAIKTAAERQMGTVTSLGRPTQPLDLDTQAKNIYDSIIAHDEELFRTTGVRRKYCLRDGGVDMPDQISSFEYKVLLLHRINQETPNECSKEDIINMIKRNISE